MKEAPVVQWIEHRFSKPRIEVRFLSRAHTSLRSVQAIIWGSWCSSNTTLCGRVVAGAIPVDPPFNKIPLMGRLYYELFEL